ncbi:NAD(P)/FAD-dependent oxidoreductase [Nocardia sp. NPDC020380]|uniref:NAD(P)/FAD-dependent oxidoreductase n=1 Tax=Nocardia sp. NPDC020380 TaxID=3364309 RepID=UPI0037AB63BC
MNATTAHRIVILGAGYTGMLTAVRLARRTRNQDVHITLVNPSNRFTERLRMHQVAAGQELGHFDIPATMAGAGVEFHCAAATAIDPENRTVTLGDGDILTYDTLVYALGSATDTGRVAGATQHAWTLNDPRAAHRFSQRLTEIATAGGTVTVVGGGLTGIEAATEVAESHPGLNVTLISAQEPGWMMGDKARAHLNKAFDRLGITRKIGVKVAKVLPDAVRLGTGELVPADLTLWTTGVKVPQLAAESGIEVDARGMIVTDPTLRSVSHPEILAVGDAAVIRQPWGELHGTCQSGMASAGYAADTLARQLRGKTFGPFRFGYIHQPVSLGRKDAVIQFTNADDTPRRWYLKGRAAVFYKESVSASPWPSFKMHRHMAPPVKFSNGGRATRATA